MLAVRAGAATRRANEEQLANLGAHVELGGSTGEWSSAAVLDAGRSGLEYFRLFDPPHARLTGRRHDFRNDFLRRYDSGADLVFGSLRADRERFDSVAAGLSDNVVALRNAGAATFESWHGGAADQARAHLDGLLARVEAVQRRFTGLAETIGETVDALDRAVYDKAVATSRLYADRVDGKSGDDVRFLVDFSRRARGDDVEDDEVADAAALCGCTPGPTGWRHRHVRVAEVATAVDAWLRGVFAPAHEAKLAAFAEICATARDKLTAGWQAFDAALDTAVGPEFLPVPRPATEPAAGGPAGGGYLEGGSVGGTSGTGGSGTAVPPGEQLTPGMAAAPMAGGQGDADRQHRTLGLALSGLTFADAATPAAVIGAEDDPATYNEAVADEIRGDEAATDPDDDADDDLW